MIIVDTDVLIDVQRGYQPAVSWFRALDVPPSIPGLVVMELLQDARNEIEVRRVLRMVSHLPVVWPSEADCERALSDFVKFHHSQGLGLLDALIGACAAGHKATLCTFNVKHYRVIAGLTTEQPYAR